MKVWIFDIERERSLNIAMTVSRFAKINSIGMYLPEKKITNEELRKMLDYDVEKYLSEKGIKVRHLAAADESTSDMAVKAAQEAINRANLKPQEIDLIILATDTPDFVTPPTSVIIQHKLGAKNAGCFDLNAACADETIGLAIASQYIMLDQDINQVLVIGAYGMTKWMDWSKYSDSSSKVLAMLFGDGAAAIILSRSEEPGYLISKIVGKGEYWDTYGIYLGTASPVDVRMIQEKRHYLRFHGNQHKVPPDFNTSLWPKLIQETTEKAGHKIEELGLVLTNQVELNVVKETLKHLNLPMDKTHWIADKYGYAGSASALMALHDALKLKKIKSGDLIFFCTSGAGFVVSSALFKWV